MHKNPDCAAVLANHIYNQMRDMDTLSPGVTYDLSQSLALSDRRRGLPSRVTEWKAWRAEKREINWRDIISTVIISTRAKATSSWVLSFFLRCFFLLGFRRKKLTFSSEFFSPNLKVTETVFHRS